MTESYHTHTVRCNHAVGTEREYIERAIQAGLKILGFSDHAPYVFPTGYFSDFRMRLEETEGYITTLQTLKRAYADDIQIYIGFEMEYYPRWFGRTMDFLENFEYDYLLLGQHFLDNEYDGGYCGMPTEDEAVLEKYVAQTMEGLQTGRFTYFAHPDLLCFTGSDAIYRRHMRTLCQRVKALGIPLEINLLGMADHRTYPSERFFRIAAEVGNEIVLGCDAHAPQRVADAQELARAHDFATACGLKCRDHVTLACPKK